MMAVADGVMIDESLKSIAYENVLFGVGTCFRSLERDDAFVQAQNRGGKEDIANQHVGDSAQGAGSGASLLSASDLSGRFPHIAASGVDGVWAVHTDPWDAYWDRFWTDNENADRHALQRVANGAAVKKGAAGAKAAFLKVAVRWQRSNRGEEDSTTGAAAAAPASVISRISRLGAQCGATTFVIDKSKPDQGKYEVQLQYTTHESAALFKNIMESSRYTALLEAFSVLGVPPTEVATPALRVFRSATAVRNTVNKKTSEVQQNQGTWILLPSDYLSALMTIFEVDADTARVTWPSSSLTSSSSATTTKQDGTKNDNSNASEGDPVPYYDVEFKTVAEALAALHIVGRPLRSAFGLHVVLVDAWNAGATPSWMD